MAIDTRNKVMRGIQGHHGDGWEGLDDALPTPNNYAEYVTSVNSEGLEAPATEAELEAGILVIDQLQADAIAEHNILKIAAIKIRDDGWASLNDNQKSKVLVHMLRDLIEG